MPEVSKDLILLLQYLTPGFLVAWILFGITSHQKPSQFERVVQAIIYALFVNFLVAFERGGLVWAGSLYSFGPWDHRAELTASISTAIALGVVIAYLINSDRLHEFLRQYNVSTRSSHPSEWCTAFERNKNWVVVHFKDERRIYGWPEIWPSDPAKGHLLLANATWIRDDEPADSEEEEEKLVLVDVADIRWLEFIQPAEDEDGNTNST
jgi:hypothetical protein